jgi:hypothetical protein
MREATVRMLTLRERDIMSDEFNKADEGTKSQPREIPKAQAMHQAAIKRFEHNYLSILREIGEQIRHAADSGYFALKIFFKDHNNTIQIGSPTGYFSRLTKAEFGNFKYVMGAFFQNYGYRVLGHNQNNQTIIWLEDTEDARRNRTFPWG